MKHTKEMIQKIKDHKAKSCGPEYNESPKLSAILLSFNHAYNVDDHCEKLTKSLFDEVIICEDGSIDGSKEKWFKGLQHKNHYVLCSNDIHELRTYEKAIYMSDAEIVCLLQDDDVLPDDDDWIEYASFLFDKYPKLAILGGARGRTLNFDKTTWGRKAHAGHRTEEITHMEPEANKDLMFIQNINIGPYFIRRSVFLELGGWDHRCSNAGEPAMLFESELCYRVWNAGYHVALTDMPVKAIDNEDQGTFIYSETAGHGKTGKPKNPVRARNLKRNCEFTVATYKKDCKKIDAIINELNSQLRAK